MRLAHEGQVISKPEDVIKDPITLEFLGLKSDAIYSESKLEHAIIGKMQQFLLELGKGFLFEARQKRFTFEEKHFYVDLVFYNYCCPVNFKTAEESSPKPFRIGLRAFFFEKQAPLIK